MESNPPQDLAQLLVETARSYGFPLAGTLDIDLSWIQSDVEHYDRWISSGYAGAMSYLVRGRDRRADPRLVFPEAKSILCVAQPYSSKPAGQSDPSLGPRYSRYLRSKDYHADIAERLELVMRGASKHWATPLQWKVCVDTSAVLERSWASLAGLGWIGKNSMLIHPQHGSYLFIGEVLISQAVDRPPMPLPNYCGNCVRCLEGCPTQAFIAPRILDSNRCISYLTLEKRAEISLSQEEKIKMGTWVAGCDLCQEVCPFNTKASRNPLAAQDQAIALNTWRELLLEDEEQYRARVKDSSLSRVKPAQFRRNLANALHNALDTIDPSTPPDWVTDLVPLVLEKFEKELDPIARSEWARCVEKSTPKTKP